MSFLNLPTAFGSAVTMEQLFNQGIWQMPAMPFVAFALGTVCAAAATILSFFFNNNNKPEIAIGWLGAASTISFGFSCVTLLIYLGG